jgi:uncharacterized protein (TIGR02996 family)
MTNDGDALFRALCANPAEDAPRLMYADWLEENGHPERAEFIRLQCELWNAAPALTAARTRASELQRAFGNLWYNELPAIPGLEWRSLFVRGFIDNASTFRIRNVSKILERAFTATPLQYLTVTNLLPGQFRELLDNPLLARLKALHLPGIVGREEARLLTAARERFPETEIE